MLIATVGLPASGKTTWAKTFCDGFEPDDPTRFFRVSSDDLRLMIYGARNIISPVEFDLLDTCVCELLKQHKNVVIDATNLKKKHRAKWGSVARMEGHEYEVKYFDVSLDECILRNEQRLGQPDYVPQESIIQMAKSFEVPTLSEGYLMTTNEQDK